LSKTVTLIAPKSGLSGSVTPPPSKSYTHRAILLASLAEGESTIWNPLHSRDTDATIRGCISFGAKIEDGENSLRIRGCRPQTPDDIINVENSGTTLRFLSSALSLTPSGFSVLTGDLSIRRRPMQPLLDSLTQLGVHAKSTRGNGCAPVIIGGGGLRGGEVKIRGDISSQFISSLLISAPMADKDVVIKTDDVVSKPYIDATITMMRKFGAKVTNHDYSYFIVRSGTGYSGEDFTVPGDFSSASFIAGAVAMIGGEVELCGLNAELPQGDSSFLSILGSMGVEVKQREKGYMIRWNGDKLQGGTFDLTDTPDLLPVLAVLGLKCKSQLEITGVMHARYKETDRISTIVQELLKLGVDITERPDGIVIKPGKLRRAKLDAHGDHRMFMAFSMISLLFPQGIPVFGEESLDVSYPSYLEDISKLGVIVRRQNI